MKFKRKRPLLLLLFIKYKKIVSLKVSYYADCNYYYIVYQRPMRFTNRIASTQSGFNRNSAKTSLLGALLPQEKVIGDGVFASCNLCRSQR